MARSAFHTFALEAYVFALEAYVCERFNLTYQQFFYSKRKNAVMARQLYSYALHQYCGWSCAMIANNLGEARSTVRRGVEKIRCMSDIPEVIALARELRGVVQSTHESITTPIGG